MNKSISLKITESAIMIALATILSMATFINLPFGGSVTILSMLPIIIIAYRHGTKWGFITAFTYSILQMILGLKSFSYVTGWKSVLAVAFLDYIFAFVVLGLGGTFRKAFKSKGTALAMGTILACILRFLFHVISGYAIWRDISIPSQAAWEYSLLYNASYMLPETILTAVGAYFAGEVFVLDEERIKRIPTGASIAKKIYTILPICICVAVSAVLLLSMMNSEETPFDITLLTQAGFYGWLPIIVVMAVGVITSIFVSKNYKSQKSA